MAKCDLKEHDMHKRDIIFTVNMQERLHVFLPSKLEDIVGFDRVKVVYVKDGVCEQVICLNDVFVEFVEVLDIALKEALTGRCKLDESLEENLGYLWNVYLNSFRRVRSYKNIKDWIGQKYLLRSLHGVASWFYEKDGKFLLEVTPVYKWHSLDPEPEEKGEYVTYKQFMKSYKSYVVTELSRETICEWLEQTKYLLALIECNDDKYLVRDEDMIEKYKAFMEVKKDE